MGDTILSFRDFSQRLWLSSGRDTIPPNALRRCVGSAPEPEALVKSRWGSTLRFSVPNVISMGCFTNAHYLYDGANLWAAALNDVTAHIIDVGYNGQRATFVMAPPAVGLPDYLFMIGGGKLKKVDPSNNLTNWGIDVPQGSATAALVAQDITTIDTFNIGGAAAWTNADTPMASPFQCAISDYTATDDKIYAGTASLRVIASDGPWAITKDLTGAPLNLAVYANGDISLQTDYISLWVYMRSPANVVWFWLMFDVDPVNPDFKHNYYRAVVQVVPTTANTHAANASVILSADADRWVQLAVAKSQFQRVGTALNLDWSAVQKVRIEGGNALAASAPAIYLDSFTMFGGVGLGTGPAALSGGSELQYLFTYGNNTTGNDSNPSAIATTIDGVADQAVKLTGIPISPDPQVGNRKIWRTSEGGSLFFLLDTIADNTTTTYTDKISSLPGQPIVITPWQANATVVSGYYIDGGTGYYFKCTTGGTTGATVPNWTIPETTWTGLGAYDTLNETILPSIAHGGGKAFQVIQTGITGPEEPKWPAGLNATVVDGTVIWQNIGALTTNDNTAVWTCQGINALPSLGTDAIQYDNNLFPVTCGDAVYFQGSMFVSRDSANPNYVYISTPGKSEGYANIVRVGSQDDSIEKLVVWDGNLWVFTSRFVYPLTGTPPAMAPLDAIIGAEGTSWPFTVVPTPFGIFYRAISGLRLFNNAANDLVGYVALGPIERGQTVENVLPFGAVIANAARDEIVFSDGITSFALGMSTRTWRIIGLGFNAIEYHDEMQIVHVATPGAVYDLEVDGVTTDNGAPINVEWQTPSVQLDGTQNTMTKRIFLDIDCGGQVLTPVLLVDGTEYTLPDITNVSRSTIPIPYQVGGRVIGIRLFGALTARVSWYGVWSEARTGDTSSATRLAQDIAAVSGGQQ
jgi:hypothetical protein